jgi:hypothetical protein
MVSNIWDTAKQTIGEEWILRGSALVVAFLILIVLKAAIGSVGRVHGRWTSRYTSGGCHHVERIFAQQYWRLIYGRSSAQWTEDNDHKQRNYKFLGWFSKEIFRAVYWCRNPGITDCGTFVMKYLSDGRGLSGKYIGLEGNDEAKIESVEKYEWLEHNAVE